MDWVGCCSVCCSGLFLLIVQIASLVRDEPSPLQRSRYIVFFFFLKWRKDRINMIWFYLSFKSRVFSETSHLLYNDPGIYIYIFFFFWNEGRIGWIWYDIHVKVGNTRGGLFISETNHISFREVGGWGRDPKKCTGRGRGMGSSTVEWALRPVVKYHLRRGVVLIEFLKMVLDPSPPPLLLYNDPYILWGGYD